MYVVLYKQQSIYFRTKLCKYVVHTVQCSALQYIDMSIVKHVITIELPVCHFRRDSLRDSIRLKFPTSLKLKLPFSQSHSTIMYPRSGLPLLSNTTCIPFKSKDVFFRAFSSCKRTLKCHVKMSTILILPLALLSKCIFRTSIWVYLPRIDLAAFSPHTARHVAVQHCVQCMCHTVDGGVHTESRVLDIRIRCQAHICW